MSMRWPAGVVSKTAITPSGSYSTSTAPGIWRLNDVSSFIQQNNWPNPNSDAYFDYVSLLLNGEVQNGLSSTVISDASTNQFQLSSVGNFGNSYATPYSSAYSNYFDGTGDYLTAPDNAAWDIGSAKTIEAWVYLTSGDQKIICGQVGQFWLSTGVTALGVSSGKFGISFLKSDDSWYGVSSTTSYAFNRWYYVAATWDGTYIRMFVDGVLETTSPSQSGTTWKSSSAGTLDIGTYSGDPNTYGLIGYISNVRITNSALYTTTFSVPTTPLTAVANTALLTCQSNRFIDNSTNAFAITVAGNTSISQYSPFADTTSAYGSGYFDGSTGYAIVPDNSAIKLTSGDWTLEFWMKAPSAQSLTNNGIYTSDFTAGYSGIVITANSSRQVQFTSSYSGTAWDQLFQTIGTYTDNAWAHIAVAKSGSTIYGYFNGVLGLTITSVPSTIYSASSVAAIGKYSTSYYKGNISNFRIVKGTCLYPSGTTFTPPTSPLTAVTNTSLLTLQTSAPNQNNAFLDSSANNFTITRNGNTTQGTFSPYGSLWSNYFDGTGDYLSVGSNSAFGFSSGDFTIELWVNLNSTSATQLLYDQRSSGTQVVPSVYIASNVLGYYVDGADRITTSFTSVKTWNHIAISRSGTSTKMFVNGTQVGSTYTDSNVYINSPVYIFGRWDGLYLATGYASNVRTVKGTALYTSNFTPSATPLTAVSGTSLLTCQSNRFVDNSTNAFAITANGSTSVTRFSPFNPTAAYSASTIGGSGYFDGTGDYLSTPASSQFAMSGDFTLSMWSYPTVFSGYGLLFNNGYGTNVGLLAEYDASGIITVYTNGTGSTRITSSIALKLNAWNFISLVRSGSTVTLYINGVSGGTVSNSNTIGANAVYTIGYYTSGQPENIYGYITDFRLVAGTAITSIPTAPLTAVSGTSLLCNFTNAGIPDLAMQNDLETVGNAQVSTSVKKYGTGSLAFDGTLDYLDVRSVVSPASFGTGDYTIEFWIYFNETSAEQWIVNWASTGVGTTIYLNSGVFKFYTNSTLAINSGFTPSTSTWYHVALTRASGSTKMFINGTQYGSTYTDTSSYTGASLRIGEYYSTTGYAVNGYIDDLRITNGYARYTANFTPPTSSLQNL